MRAGIDVTGCSSCGGNHNRIKVRRRPVLFWLFYFSCPVNGVRVDVRYK